MTGYPGGLENAEIKRKNRGHRVHYGPDFDGRPAHLNEAPMRIEYRLEKQLEPRQVMALYQEAGWLNGNETEADIARMLSGSFAVMAAFDAEDGRLLGMMRALSDGCSDAYMLDLVVRGEYRFQGIGREIATRLSNYLASLGIDWIVCIGAPGTEAFYSRTDSCRVMEGHTPYRWNQK